MCQEVRLLGSVIWVLCVLQIVCALILLIIEGGDVDSPTDNVTFSYFRIQGHQCFDDFCNCWVQLQR